MSKNLFIVMKSMKVEWMQKKSANKSVNPLLHLFAHSNRKKTRKSSFTSFLEQKDLNKDCSIQKSQENVLEPYKFSVSFPQQSQETKKKNVHRIFLSPGENPFSFSLCVALIFCISLRLYIDSHPSIASSI